MHKLKDLLGMMFQHLGRDNKALVRQLFELVKLQRSGQLSPFQYYDYSLCEKSVTSLDGLDYLGRKAYLQLRGELNHPDWLGVTENKWLFYAHMSSFGLPVPHTYGYYDKVNGRATDGRSLRCADDLQQLVQISGKQDFVVKPVNGSRGVDVLVLTKQAEERLVSHDGRSWSYQDLANHMSSRPFIVQERVKQHEMLNSLNPYNLNTFRVVTFVDNQGEPHIHWIGMRMGRKGSNTDNVNAGGLAVRVDRQTGVLGEGGFTEPFLTCHPDTGREFTGISIPYWEEMQALCLKAARICPLGSAGWDVAISQYGPILMETNADWAFRQQQKTTPYLTSETREHLAGYGIRQM